jgi:hypothetical protein
MSATNARMRDEIAAAGRRFEALADRIAGLRERLRPPAPGPATPLFPPTTGSKGALDDVELHFALDEPGRERP